MDGSADTNHRLANRLYESGRRHTGIIRSGGCVMPERMAAVAAALGDLDMRPGDRVLIMLPAGPGFAEAVTIIAQRGAIPLPADPLAPTHDIETIAAKANAQLVLLTADRIDTLADLSAQPPVLVDGPLGPWAAALRLRDD